ncbi:hypothetical protein HPB51_002487 [Rhipicephalus microplus]|uniref:Bifunctional lysine-specific demethylase and histidyl-hydroxylase n=1 Tax=Rhipicephalus microplus TaxID=6941 RepID=A0A9J6DEU8_RHIMP|nr:hypothetical protein HPB51_002487 [Rhipicephalus microplus]
MSKHWEQEPFVSQNRPSQAKYWSPLFGKDRFFDLLKEKQIYFAKDVAVCKYEDGKRTNFERHGRVTEAKMKKLFEGDKATLQIHQPQRWVVFIVQLEGEKCWKLYKPPVELPRTYSKDFNADEIGQPTHEFTLKADVEAALEAVLKHVKNIDGPMPVAEDLVHDFMRTRLPPFGVDRLAISEATPDGEAPGLNDRIRFRYPSHVTYTVEGDLSEGDDIASESSYSLAEQPQQQNHAKKMVLLLTSVFNNREKHMVSASEEDEEEEEDLEIAKFPLHFLDAIKKLCGSDDFIHCKDLSLPSDEDKLLLLTTLWSLHLLDVQVLAM